MQAIYAVNETDVDRQFICDQCKLTFEKDEELQAHMTEKHDANDKSETCDIKLEIFCLVENEDDVFATRTKLIDKLSELKEV